MELTSKQLCEIIAQAAKEAVCEFIKTIELQTLVSKSAAYKKYGRNKVDGWIDAGLVKFKVNGRETTSTQECSIFELEKQNNKEQFQQKYYEDKGTDNRKLQGGKASANRPKREKRTNKRV